MARYLHISPAQTRAMAPAESMALVRAGRRLLEREYRDRFEGEIKPLMQVLGARVA